MKSILSFLALLALFAGASESHSATQGALRILYIKQADCVYCNELDKTLQSSLISEKLFGRFSIESYDLSTDASIRLSGQQELTLSELVSEFRIVGTPALIFMNAEQEPVLVRQGRQQKDDLIAAIDYVETHGYESLPFGVWLRIHQ
ncbi:thioredoxin-related protein [Marinobacterium sp. MBR-111]|jgi:thioredoxin-related protein|uniref:thioredoxin fold domain-containing protein n=1 Tax=Marinobacterium sp. MBR-111 TaxID=3156463 RepID=UPI003398978D